MEKKVINNGGSSVTITLGVSVGLDYNDLTLPSDGHLFEEIISTGEVGEVIIDNISSDNLYNDEVDTFVTGEDPNNYIWYSGKLWRAVSVNNTENTVKLVTQWDISTITYSSGSSAFAGSYMEEWLNDTSIDGFLGNLRNYENFIVTDVKWDATMDDRELGSITRPNGTTIVIDTVGLLNTYEYQSSFYGTDYDNSYLNIPNLRWWLINPNDASNNYIIDSLGGLLIRESRNTYGVKPSIYLKSNVKIVNGDGTVDNPYRLNGDNDTDLEGTLLNTRYSGEYIRFGSGENNLYRIVSHENGAGTKITSAEPLKENGSFKTVPFDSNSSVNYSSANTIGVFLNNDYLNTENGYLADEDIAMIEESTTWYLGAVGDGVSYKLAKYKDETETALVSNTTQAKVGLLRFGELMAGVFTIPIDTECYWLLNHNYKVQDYNDAVRAVEKFGYTYAYEATSLKAVKPSLNLKSNVVITGGDGTLQNPFSLELAN